MEESVQIKRWGFVRSCCCPLWLVQGIRVVSSVLLLIVLFGVGVLLAFNLTNTTFAILAQQDLSALEVWRETTTTYLARLSKNETEFGVGQSIVLNVKFPIQTYNPSLVTMGFDSREPDRLSYRPINDPLEYVLSSSDLESLKNHIVKLVYAESFCISRSSEFRIPDSELLLVKPTLFIWPKEFIYLSEVKQGFGLSWLDSGGLAVRLFRSEDGDSNISSVVDWSSIVKAQKMEPLIVGLGVRDITVEIPVNSERRQVSSFAKQVIDTKLDICKGNNRPRLEWRLV